MWLARRAPRLVRRCRAPALPARRFRGDDGGDIDVDAVAYGYMGSKALFAALELGIFDHVAGAETATIETLQTATGIDAPRLQTLVTALTALRALERSDDGSYRPSPNAAKFLVRESDAYYGDYLQNQVGGQFYGQLDALADVMRGERTPSYAAWFEEDSEAAEAYSLAQHNGSAATGRALLRKARAGAFGAALQKGLALPEETALLDVGGGAGAFSYVFAGAGARAIVLDLPGVAAAGRRFQRTLVARGDVAADVASRVQFADLDVTDDAWPVGAAAFDVVLMSYISGSIPDAALDDVYANARAALKPGGALVVHDFMVDDTLDGPPSAALWALQHVTVSPEGLGLSPSAVAARLEAAGFGDVGDAAPLVAGMTRVIVATK